MKHLHLYLKLTFIIFIYYLNVMNDDKCTSFILDIKLLSTTVYYC